MNLINTAEHVFAKAAQDLVTAAKFLANTVLPVLKKASASEQVVEQVTALVDPAAVNVERAAFAVLGTVIKVIESADTAASADGLNVALDAQLIADIRSIIPAVKANAVKTS